MTTVGVIGCGVMGAGMVKNLLLHNYEVLTYDVNPQIQEKMLKLGARPVGKLKDLSRKASYVLLSLPTPEILLETLTGEHGLIKSMQEGSFILDMSTTDVTTTINLSQEAAKYGISYFDCPVSGGPTGAEDGTLTIMVGGKEDQLDQIKPVLRVLGTDINYIGESGAGQVVKLCNNIVVAGLVTLLSEALKVGEKAGVPVWKVAEVMQMGSAQNKVLSVFGPNIMDQTHENVLFMLSHMKKDVDLFLELSQFEGINMTVSPVVQALFETASKKGLGHFDTSAVGLLVEQTDFIAP